MSRCASSPLSASLWRSSEKGLAYLPICLYVLATNGQNTECLRSYSSPDDTGIMPSASEGVRGPIIFLGSTRQSGSTGPWNARQGVGMFWPRLVPDAIFGPGFKAQPPPTPTQTRSMTCKYRILNTANVKRACRKDGAGCRQAAAHTSGGFWLLAVAFARSCMS